MTLPDDTLVIILRPKIAKAKYSGLENCRATFANCGANKIKQMVARIPGLQNDVDIVDNPKARPGCPIFVAIG